METQKKFLNFYGVTLSIFGDQEIVSKLLLDFNFFYTEKIFNESIKISINFSKPSYEQLKNLTASMYKTDCISYDNKNIRYVDYHGQCLVIYNKKEMIAEIYSLDRDLLYEISYLFIHSRVGELLDIKGFHRVHSCSFSYNNNNYIVILPQGAGKSTLLFKLLESKKVKIISDDTPLIDNKGNIYPFPIRIGLCNDIDTSNISQEYIYTFKRRQFQEKKLLSYNYFKDMIEYRMLPTIIIYGVRVFSNNPKIIKTNIFIIFKELFKSCIVGYGLPQVLEYFLVGGMKDFVKKLYIATTRFYSCIMLLLKVKGNYCFYLSNDINKNSIKFLDFFK